MEGVMQVWVTTSKAAIMMLRFLPEPHVWAGATMGRKEGRGKGMDVSDLAQMMPKRFATIKGL